MSGDMLFVFGLLLVTIILFVSDRVRLDVVAVSVILVLMLSGLLTPGEALAGFGDPVVLLIAGLFVVGEGLYRTGVAFAVGDWLMRVAGTHELRLLVMLMLVVAGLSAFMSSTGAVAIFIPIVLSLAAKAGISPSRLLLPIALASLMGGMLTLIGTPPNLVVSIQLEREGLDPFRFLQLHPHWPAGIDGGYRLHAYRGRHLLPSRVTGEQTAACPPLSEGSCRGLWDQGTGPPFAPERRFTVSGSYHRPGHVAEPLPGDGRRHRTMKVCSRPHIPRRKLESGDILLVAGTDSALTSLRTGEKFTRGSPGGIPYSGSHKGAGISRSPADTEFGTHRTQSGRRQFSRAS